MAPKVNIGKEGKRKRKRKNEFTYLRIN